MKRNSEMSFIRDTAAALHKKSRANGACLEELLSARVLTPTFVSKRRSLPRTRWSTLSSYHLLLCTLPFCSTYFPLFSRLLLQTMSLATTRLSLA